MTKNRLKVMNFLPEGILALDATELYTKLEGPTLIHLEGRQNPAVFISVLLHGNEHTSWDAVRAFLSEYQTKALPRAVSIFIGNVAAARLGLRRLDEQKDFNRMWGGAGGPAEPLMQAVTEQMQERGVFLSIDVHNNTGKNPHYACTNSIDPKFLYLASLFSRTIVYFIKPDSVQSMAFSKLCPSVTVECGLSGDQLGTEHALEFIRACVHLSEFPTAEAAIKDVIVFHTVAVVKVPSDLSLGFDTEHCDINLNSELEYFNFRELPKGSRVGRVRSGVSMPLSIISDTGECVGKSYLSIKDGYLETRRRVIPAMITKDIGVIRQDCLCYLMEEYALDA